MQHLFPSSQHLQLLFLLTSGDPEPKARSSALLDRAVAEGTKEESDKLKTLTRND
jgi:hypothetical protein